MAAENDIVLIYHEDQPLVFARVEDIQPDVKKDWYHIKLMLLQLPVQVVTWILKDDYINGAEFTMGGRRMRLEKVAPPEPEENLPQEHGEENSREESGSDASGPEDSREDKVISLKNRKPKSE
ncbi:MAG: hypothetical protein KGY42_08865 [Desulfobacterales bacterium]|nr:hypothetical protein [Desulfobacterales bacterium]MBS3754346.1 hypothetical protein [Desulfobacterales bacterium]